MSLTLVFNILMSYLFSDPAGKSREVYSKKEKRGLNIYHNSLIEWNLGQKKTSLGYGCQMAKMLEKADIVEELILQVRDLYQRGDG